MGDNMEGASVIALSLVLLAGGGATGAFMMGDGGMMGHHGMMGGDGHECPYADGDHYEECQRDDGGYPEECEEHSYEDCPYHGEGDYARRGGSCCDGA